MGDAAARRRLRRQIAKRRAELGVSDAAAYEVIWAEARSGEFGPVPDGRGWYHEDFHQADKAAVFAKARGGGRIERDDIVAASRLYTPTPIVELILQNTLGALWVQMHPDSGLASKWHWLARRAVGPRTPPRPLRELRLLDPCCGAGAFLLAAADMLVDMAEDERRLAADGRLPEDWCLRPGEDVSHIVGAMLHGGDLDAQAVAIARDELAARAGGAEVGNVRVVAPPLGSLDPVLWAAERFDVVVTNPPWVGFRQLDPELKALVGGAVPLGAQDLAVATQARCLQLVADDGRVGTVTPAAWLAGRDALRLRRHILDRGGPVLVARLGQGVFGDAPLVFVAVTIVAVGSAPTQVVVAHGRAGPEGRDLSRVLGRSTAVPRATIARLPLAPFAPAAPRALLEHAVGARTIGDLADTFDGVWTGDNARDLRYWWTIGERDGWVPISGGQGYRPWCAPTLLRIRSHHVAHQPDRAGCLEYARVAGGRLGVRHAAAGTAALAGVVTIVPRDEDPRTAALIMAVCNTRIGAAWVATLTAGLNFNPGYLAQIPLPAAGACPDIAGHVERVVELQRAGLRADPSHDGFVEVPSPWLPSDDAVERAIDALEQDLAAAFGLNADDVALLPPVRPPAPAVSPVDDLLLVAVLRAVGFRWPNEPPVPSCALAHDEVCDAVVQALADAGAPSGAIDPARWVRDRLTRVADRRFRRVSPVRWNGTVLTCH